MALLMLGDWDAAGAELTRAADSYGLAGYEFLACQRGWLAALRGDTAAAQVLLADLADLRATEDHQDQAMVSLVEGFTAARRQPRAALGHSGALGISYDCLRWAWPLAARAAHALGDAAAVGELLNLLEGHQPGHLAPMLRAERDLARARLTARDSGPDTGAAAFTAAIGGLREQSTPTTSPTACSTTPSTSPACTTPRPRPAPPAKPATSPIACAASRCWPGPGDLTPAAPPQPAPTT
jgi:hypothetical protein